MIFPHHQKNNLNILIGPPYKSPACFGSYIHAPNIKVFASEQDKEAQQFPYEITYRLPEHRFEHILAQLPMNWEPDVVVWWDLSHHAIPPGIENCPYPTVLIPSDWQYLFYLHTHYLKFFDYVLTENYFIKILREKGIKNCAFWPCFSFSADLFYVMPEEKKIYDALFLGSTNFYDHPTRGLHVEQLAQLGDTYRIKIGKGYQDKAYRQILNQSRIVVNHSCIYRHEMNTRCYEIPACGSLLFCEDTNEDIGYFLTDRESCVLYNLENLQELICYYLEHEDERQSIAQRGHEKILNYTYEKQFELLFNSLPNVIESFKGSKHRPLHKLTDVHKEFIVASQLGTTYTHGARELAVNYLSKNKEVLPPLSEWSHRDPIICHKMACLLIESIPKSHSTVKETPQYLVLLDYALTLFQLAVQKYPLNPVFRINMAWALELKEEWEQAKGHYIQLLHEADTLAYTTLDEIGQIATCLGFWGAENLRFNLEFEHIAASYSNQPMVRHQRYQQLIIWQAEQRLGRIHIIEQNCTQSILHYQRAIAIQPEYCEIYIQLGCLFHAQSNYDDALDCFKEALLREPFIPEIWKMLTETPISKCSNLVLFNHLIQKCQSILKVFEAVEPPLANKMNEQLVLSEIALLGTPGRDCQGHSSCLFGQQQTEYSTDFFQQLNVLLSQNKSLSQLLWPVQPTLEWHPELPCESLPDLSAFDQLFQYESSQHSVQIFISKDRQVFPHYQRSYDTPSNLEKRVLGPDSLPFFFPPCNNDMDLEGLEHINILVLASSDLDTGAGLLLKTFATQYANRPDVTCTVWFPLHPPTDTDLIWLKQNLGETDATIILLPHAGLPQQQGHILKQMDLVVGHPQGWTNYYLWWALALGKPILLDAPLLPYAGIQPEDLEKFICSDWLTGLKQCLNESGWLRNYSGEQLQTQLSLFHDQKSLNLLLNTLWKRCMID